MGTFSCSYLAIRQHICGGVFSTYLFPGLWLPSCSELALSLIFSSASFCIHVRAKFQTIILGRAAGIVPSSIKDTSRKSRSPYSMKPYCTREICVYNYSQLIPFLPLMVSPFSSQVRSCRALPFAHSGPVLCA